MYKFFRACDCCYDVLKMSKMDLEEDDGFFREWDELMEELEKERKFNMAFEDFGKEDVPKGVKQDRKKPDLSYTKQDLLDTLKRHSAKDKINYERGCAFTQNSIIMVIRFVCVENGFPKKVTEKIVNDSITLTRELGGCLMGKSRLVIAGAFMYIALNRKLSQYYLSDRLYITETSLRVIFKIICNNIDIPKMFPSPKFKLAERILEEKKRKYGHLNYFKEE